jgi:putative lipoprotein
LKPLTRNLLLMLALALLAYACVAANDQASRTVAEFDLVGTHWWVEDIDGGGVIDRSHTTIDFIETGKVAGDTGCNRWSGAFTRDGQSLSFGPLAGTRRACAPALMDQESRFYQAMAKVVRWEVAGSGLLQLLDENGETVIRAAPTDPEE